MEEKDIRAIIKKVNELEVTNIVGREAKTICEYRATHPECRWCLHRSAKPTGRYHCAVKDTDYLSDKGIVGKIRASLCPCYCIK